MSLSNSVDRKSIETLSGVSLYANANHSDGAGAGVVGVAMSAGSGFVSKSNAIVGNCRGYTPPPRELAQLGAGSAQKLDTVVTYLWIITPLAASVSLCVVLAALASPYWLITVERMPNPMFNGTGLGGDDEDEGGEYLAKRTQSGLWTLCTTNPGDKVFHCGNIEYFPGEEYSPDPNDSTMAIPYAVTRSAAFFLGAAVLLAWGYVSCLWGLCVKRRRLYTFVGGVLFVVSGLFMLIGLIMYISVFKAEVGSKLRPRSPLQPPLFTFRYGYGFLLHVCGFVSTELAGTAAVFLYIHWHQVEFRRKNMQGGGNGKRPRSSINYLALDRAAPLAAGLPPLGLSLMGAPCRRHHPEAYIDSRSLQMRAVATAGMYRPSPVLQRRYFFDKEPPPPPAPPHAPPAPCIVHRPRPQSLSTSLRDVSLYDFPPSLFPNSPELPDPPDQLFRANHVSITTADVTSHAHHVAGDDTPPLDSDWSPSIQHEFVTFDLDQPIEQGQWQPPMRRNYSTDTLRRTTPV